MHQQGESIFQTLRTIRGNQRACLYLEPLWGIPYNLYLPFVSVYMAALGMSAVQIGLISTVFFFSQMCWSLFSGVITDKLGRRKATVIFDLLSWSLPALLWMCAQGFEWFLVAAVFNGAWRVTETSWGLLLIEDAPEDKLINMYAISHIAGLIAGFVSPLAYFFVKAQSVVPAMRALYALTFVMMTAKFLILYFWSKETSVGQRRMAQTGQVRLFASLKSSRFVLMRMLKNKRTMLTVLLLACYCGMRNVNDTFWPLLVTSKLNIATENLSIFSTVKTLAMLLCYFVIGPRLNIRRFHAPLSLAFLMMLCQQALMILMPAGAYGLVIVSALLEAVAISILSPMTSSLQMLNIEREERARMLGLFYFMTMLVTAPLGVIGGALSGVNPSLPFVLNAGLIVGALLFSHAIWKEGKAQGASFES